MLLSDMPSVSEISGRFVFFRVSDAVTGEERYFLRSGDIKHLSIQALFEEAIRKYDPEGKLTCETLGGAFIHIYRKKKAVVINLKSSHVGPIRKLSVLLELLRDAFPEFNVHHGGLENATD